MQTVDQLFLGRFIAPVEPMVVREDWAIAVNGGRIVELLPSAEAVRRYAPRTAHQLNNHLLIPGLINAHTHAAMTLMRGLADDLPLMVWLNEHIWPAEGRFVDPNFVRDGSELAMAEMLRGGVTCFNDMYFFADTTAAVAKQVGMRAVVGLIIIDVPTQWAKSPQEYFERAVALHETLKEEPLISATLAPHAPYTVSGEHLEAVAALAAERDLPIHIHLHETCDEVAQMVAREGLRPFAWLDRLGLMGPQLVAVHMTQLEAAEIQRLAEVQAHVIHCPEANMKLASGFCPVAKLIQAGVNVALGTDGAASNNDLDLLGEMRSAALLAKAVAEDAAALSAEQALAMATINAARALRLDGEIGSLVPGKWADIVAIDLATPETEPLYHPISQLVYATPRCQVTDVWVAGRQLLQRRELTTIELSATLTKVRRWRSAIAAADAHD